MISVLWRKVRLLTKDKRQYWKIWQEDRPRDIDFCESCDKGRFKFRLFELWIVPAYPWTFLFTSQTLAGAVIFMLKIPSSLLCYYYSILALRIRFNIQSYKTKQKTMPKVQLGILKHNLKIHLPATLLGLAGS